MKRSSDLATEERMKLQKNFDLFATTRRKEAERVRESGEMALSNLSERIDLASEEGILALQHMTERGDLAAGAGEFSLKQFQESTSRELEFASTFMEMDIETARRKGEAADRAIAAIEENEQYIQTGYGLQSRASSYSERYNDIGMITNIAGQGINFLTDFDFNQFTRPSTKFFSNYGSWGGGPNYSYSKSGSGYIE